MAEQRGMRRVGHSWIVAVPARVRAHLRAKPGGSLYWHLGGPREAVVSLHAQRIGGRPAGLDLAPQLAAAHREIERLRAQLAGRPRRVFNEGTAAGVAVAERIGFAFEQKLTDLTAAVLRVERRMSGAPAPRVPRGRSRGPRAQRAVESYTLPDASPSPSAPPS